MHKKKLQQLTSNPLGNQYILSCFQILMNSNWLNMCKTKIQQWMMNPLDNQYRPNYCQILMNSN